MIKTHNIKWVIITACKMHYDDGQVSARVHCERVTDDRHIQKRNTEKRRKCKKWTKEANRRSGIKANAHRFSYYQPTEKGKVVPVLMQAPTNVKNIIILLLFFGAVCVWAFFFRFESAILTCIVCIECVLVQFDHCVSALLSVSLSLYVCVGIEAICTLFDIVHHKQNTHRIII